MRARLRTLVPALTVLVACSTPPVDAICALGFTPAPSETVISSPSLDCYRPGTLHTDPATGDTIPGPPIPAGACPSATCLRVPLGHELPAGSYYPPAPYGLSTARCESDSDCIAESPCVTGFTCGVPPGLTVGQFCCQKYCVCKDYVEIPAATGVLPMPIACDPSLSDNACCNLPGRTGSSLYPTCAI